MSCIRAVLGVRDSTDTDLCLHEIMMPSVDSLIHEIQLKYLLNIVNNPDKHQLLLKAMEMGRNVKLPSGHTTKCKAMKYIDKIIEKNDKEIVIRDMNERRTRITVSTKTKTMLYKEWNPTLAVHDVYITRKCFPENWRISWTRFKLGSTNLPAEKNRWTQFKGRELKCICGEIQTEKHVLFTCELRVNRTTNLQEILNNENQRQAMKVIHDTLEKFESR